MVPNGKQKRISPKDSEKKMKKQKYCESEGGRVGENKLINESDDLPSWIVKLREQFSCAFCLEICYEPTSTWCGHSFCRECLKLALKWDRNCPTCLKYIGEVRSCKLKVNMVIWNIIRLLFPREVEAWKVAIRNDTLPSNIILSKEQWFESAELKFREQKPVAVGENEFIHQNNALPSCIDKLKEELSCAICLEICYEPATTWCGHSFCRRCLRFSARLYDQKNKCPKCPKCRRSLCKVRPHVILNPIVNLVVWNTIQLLFPQEVEARKQAIEIAKKNKETSYV